MDKPRGFFAIGRGDARRFLADRPVTVIWGVGRGDAPAAGRRRHRDRGRPPVGWRRRRSPAATARWGRGSPSSRAATTPAPSRPAAGARACPPRPPSPTTSPGWRTLEKRLWPLAEKVSRRLKAEGIGARTITVKLKRADFRILTRSATLAHPTQSAETIWRAGARLVGKEADGTPWRLIGIGTSRYVPAGEADPPDLADPRSLRRRDMERAIDSIRERFGDESIGPRARAALAPNVSRETKVSSVDLCFT